MTTPAKVADRFAQAARDYELAMQAMETKNLRQYERHLVSAAQHLGGALEWALKAYLRGDARPRMSLPDQDKLKQPNFHDMCELITAYAIPAIDPALLSRLYDCRSELRNPAEHQGTVPSVDHLVDGFAAVAEIVRTYLPQVASDINVPVVDALTDPGVQQLLRAYLESIKVQHKYMDLGGISPKVGSKVVRIQMSDLFVPLRAASDEDIARVDALDGPEVGFERLPIAVEDGAAPGKGRRLSMVAEVVRKRRLVLLGDPGSGKSTVVRYLCYSIAEHSSAVGGLAGLVPILIRAADYSAATTGGQRLSIFDYIVSEHSERSGDLFRWALASGRAFVAIDGLDEVVDPAARTRVARRIEDLAAEFPEDRLLVTSRLVGYRNNPLGLDFSRVTLAEFDDDQALAFLRNWYAAVDAESGLGQSTATSKRQAKSLWESINSSPGVRKLASNPLLLTIIAQVNLRGTKLPNRRVDLYQIATETLVENWPLRQRGLSLDSDEILRVLRPIAYQVVNGGRSALIGEREFRPLFEAEIRDVRGLDEAQAHLLGRELLRTIEDQTGFFIRKGEDDLRQDVYGFLHLTFAEYLAACHLAELWSGNRLNVRDFAHVAKWHEVLLLMAGRIGGWAVPPATRLVADVLHLESEFEDVLHRDLVLAVEILSDNVRVTRDLFDRIIVQAISASAQSAGTDRAVVLGAYLAEIATVSPIPNPKLLVETAIPGATQRVQDVYRLLLGDRDPGLAVRDCRALAKEIRLQRGSSGVSYLTWDSAGDDPVILMVPLGARPPLVLTPDPSLVDALRRGGLAVHTAQSLLKRQPVGAVAPYLVDLSRTEDVDPSELARALANCRWRAGYEVLASVAPEHAARLFPPLLGIAAVDPGPVGIAAMEAADWAMFAAREIAYGRLAAAETRKCLVEASHAPNPNVRSRALGLLLGSPWLAYATSRWRAVLSDPSPDMRLAAVEAFTSLDGPKPPALVNSLRSRLRDDTDANVRYSIGLAIMEGHLGGVSPEDLLHMAFAGCPLPGSGWASRRCILALLALYETWPEDKDCSELDVEVDRWIVDSDSDADLTYPNQRVALRPQKQSRALSVAERRFSDSRPRVRLRAGRVWLAARPKARTATELSTLLNDDSTVVKAGIIRALQQDDLEDEAVLTCVLDGLVSGDEVVAASSSSTLTEITSPSARASVRDRVRALAVASPTTAIVDVLSWSLSTD